MLSRGFEPDLSCIALRARSLSYHISITYDRDVAGEDERARACADVLRDALRSLGYLPYRLGIDAMGAMNHVEASYGLALRALKQCFDPDGVIAPGRYMPTGTGA
jgi:4-cresol dehydrogenase (hydroxylating)